MRLRWWTRDGKAQPCYHAAVALETIDQVLAALDSIIDRSYAESSRLGYFAALYHRVTRRVKEGIAAGRFEDGPRMERLDVIFASRYLDAYDAFRSGGTASRSWMLAFRVAPDPAPCAIQHLLAGMNAHINLDLGIAAAEVAPGASLGALQSDFNQINNVLAEETFRVESAMEAVSPLMKLFNAVALKTDNRLINFSMTKARDFAWNAAIRIAADPANRDVHIGALDAAVALLGNTVVHPPLSIELKLVPIRAAEEPDVRRIIQALWERSATAQPAG